MTQFLAVSARARKLLSLTALPVALGLVAAGCIGVDTTSSQTERAGFGAVRIHTKVCTFGACERLVVVEDEDQIAALRDRPGGVRSDDEGAAASDIREQMLMGYRIDNALQAPATVTVDMTTEDSILASAKTGAVRSSAAPKRTERVVLHRDEAYSAELERFVPSGADTQWVGYVASEPSDIDTSWGSGTYQLFEVDAAFGTDELRLTDSVHAAAAAGYRRVNFATNEDERFDNATDPIECRTGEGRPSSATCVLEPYGDVRADEELEGEGDDFDEASRLDELTTSFVPVRTARVAPISATTVTAGTSATIPVDLGVGLPGDEERDLTVSAALDVAGSASTNINALRARAGVTHNALSVTVAPAANAPVGAASVTLTIRADGEVIRTAAIPVNVVAAPAPAGGGPSSAGAPKDTKAPVFTFVKAYRTTKAQSVLDGLVQPFKTSEAGKVTGVVSNALPAGSLGKGGRKKSMVNVYATGAMTVTKAGTFAFKFAAKPDVAKTIAPRSYARQFPMRLTLTITDTAGNTSLIRRIFYVKIPKA